VSQERCSDLVANGVGEGLAQVDSADLGADRRLERANHDVAGDLGLEIQGCGHW
jgi:hypothetical protein